MPDTISNHKVIGQLIIEKINVDKYILDNHSESALDASICWFWFKNGQKVVNEEGNLCIEGHNYKGIFQDLKDLKIGDKFTLIGKDGRKVNYQIYEIHTTEPTDVSDIEQNTDGKREVTLITCTVGAKKRLILKAQESFVL
jgi:sortase A